MKIVIVRETKKSGDWYYAYRAGLLSRLGIFCLFNKVLMASGKTPEECIKEAKRELAPNPPLNRKVISTEKI